MSPTGPLDAYIIFPNIGILRINTHNEPIIFPSSSSANITSGFQNAFFNSAHSKDCWKLHLSSLSKNSLYFISGTTISFWYIVCNCSI